MNFYGFLSFLLFFTINLHYRYTYVYICFNHTMIKSIIIVLHFYCKLNSNMFYFQKTSIFIYIFSK